ncbi:MAG TPA: hypothetical protein VGH13_10470 [Xanthobacteraceae bacterium]
MVRLLDYESALLYCAGDWAGVLGAGAIGVAGVGAMLGVGIGVGGAIRLVVGVVTSFEAVFVPAGW